MPRGRDVRTITQQVMRTWIGGLTLNIASLLFLTGLAWGQGVTGRIVGTVQDSSHAALKATVTVKNQDTNVEGAGPNE